jgi:protein TonB
MSVRKTTRADLRRHYAIYVEVGLIAALSILIAAFRLDWSPDTDFDLVMSEQEQIEMEEVQQTQQIDQPPPPPRPPVPVEVPDDEVLDDEVLDLDASLDLDQPVASTPPPPPSDDSHEQEAEPEFFMAVEKMPEPIGGLEAIYQRANRYPEVARRAGVEGTVTVTFIVDVNGEVKDPVVLRGLGAGLDEIAVEAIVNTPFEPGRQRDRAVPVKMSIPITFVLR